MSSSDPLQQAALAAAARRDTRREVPPRQVPPPPGSRASVPYTRFIPREELQGFAAWMPDAFGEPAPDLTNVATLRPGMDGHPVQPNGVHPASRPPVPPASFDDFNATAAAEDSAAAAAAAEAAAGPTLEELQAAWQAELQSQVAAARQQGYQDGYRDGLVALDSFKQSYAQQVGAQVAQVLLSLDREVDALEQQLAGSVARIAAELARQVVRSELAVRPALITQVAQEAVNSVLMSARHITVHLHPDDQALVAQGCDEVLAARGARLVVQPGMARGGCRIESDAGVIDARIATRWAQATLALGAGVPWDDDEAAGAATAGGDA